MDVRILEESKGRLLFELDSDHGFCTLLKKELYNDKTVSVASYTIDHPLVGKPRFLIEAADPKKALNSALDRLSKEVKTFADAVKGFK